MRMCYVYAVVPQPCFIRKNQKPWNNSVAFVYWRVVCCVVFCSLHVVKVKLHQQRTSIQQRTSMHARMPRMCAATSNHDAQQIDDRVRSGAGAVTDSLHLPMFAGVMFVVRTHHAGCDDLDEARSQCWPSLSPNSTYMGVAWTKRH